MRRLIAMIDEYRDAHGQPSDASIARAIGAKPQTISSWRTRGMKTFPDKVILRELARYIGRSEADVLYAVGVDTGYIVEVPETPDPAPDSETA